MNWIDINFELPELDDEVIITDGKYVSTGTFGRALSHPEDYPKAIAMRFRPSSGQTWFDITHWMPLPEPPKDDK